MMEFLRASRREGEIVSDETLSPALGCYLAPAAVAPLG